MERPVIAVDIAKKVFQLHWVEWRPVASSARS